MLEKPDIPDAALIVGPQAEHRLQIVEIAFLPLGGFRFSPFGWLSSPQCKSNDFYTHHLDRIIGG